MSNRNNKNNQAAQAKAAAEAEALKLAQGAKAQEETEQTTQAGTVSDTEPPVEPDEVQKQAEAQAKADEEAKAAAEEKAKTQAELVKKNDSNSKEVLIAVNHPQGVKFKVVDNSGDVSFVELQGNAHNLKGEADARPLPVGGYGLTSINRDAWEYIKKNYQHLPLLKNKLIFEAGSNSEYAKKAIKERKGERNGLEPIAPNKTKTSPNEK